MSGHVHRPLPHYGHTARLNVRKEDIQMSLSVRCGLRPPPPPTTTHTRTLALSHSAWGGFLGHILQSVSHQYLSGLDEATGLCQEPAKAINSNLIGTWLHPLLSAFHIHHMLSCFMTNGFRLHRRGTLIFYVSIMGKYTAWGEMSSWSPSFLLLNLQHVNLMRNGVEPRTCL